MSNFSLEFSETISVQWPLKSYFQRSLVQVFFDWMEIRMAKSEVSGCLNVA